MSQSQQRPVHPSAPPRTGGGAPHRTGGLGSQVSLGKVLGIPVRADWSLLFIVVLIALNLAAGLFPAWHPAWGVGLRWGVAFGAAVLFVVSILLHELSHAIVGRALGARIRGITLFMFGGIAHVEREPSRPAAELWMAIVGPVTSVVIGASAILLGSWFGAHALAGARSDGMLAAVRQLGPAATLLLWLGPVNLLLAGFNLIPGFPLDGGRVLRAFLWWVTGDLTRATRWASRVGQGFAWLLIGLGISMGFGVMVPVFGGGLFQGLWLVLIGWFLNSAARASFQQQLLREAVGDTSVAQLMDTGVQTVAPDVSVASLVHERLVHGEQRCYPVVEDGALKGLVCVRDTRLVAPSEWESTPVRRVMTPTDELTTLEPDEDAEHAVELLAEKDVEQIPVVDHGVLRGVVQRRDVVRWVELHRGS
jgi:Zn-dependent protease/CBS domain-containing protein